MPMKNIFPFADSDSDFFNHSRIDDPNMTGSISARRYRPNVTFQKNNYFVGCFFSFGLGFGLNKKLPGIPFSGTWPIGQNEIKTLVAQPNRKFGSGTYFTGQIDKARPSPRV